MNQEEERTCVHDVRNDSVDSSLRPTDCQPKAQDNGVVVNVRFQPSSTATCLDYHH